MTQGSEGWGWSERYDSQPSYGDSALFDSIDMSDFSRYGGYDDSTVYLPEVNFFDSGADDPFSYFVDIDVIDGDRYYDDFDRDSAGSPDDFFGASDSFWPNDDIYWNNPFYIEYGPEFFDYTSDLTGGGGYYYEPGGDSDVPGPDIGAPGGAGDDVAPPGVTDGEREQPDLNGRTVRDTVQVGDQEREYFIHRPANADPDKPLPVVLIYHGVGSNEVGGVGAEHMEEVTRFSEKADEEGFIAVYMQGNPDRNHSWNNGQWAFSRNDDIEYTKQVIEEVSRENNVDSSRIYAVGFSQGESFVHTAANDPELRETFAAVGVVGGWMTGRERLGETESETRPVGPRRPGYPRVIVEGPDNADGADPLSIISIHSTADNTVPIDGRWNFPIADRFAGMRPEAEEQDYYRLRNGIDAPVSVSEISDGREVVGREYTSINPQTGEEVTMVELDGLGHVWPGGTRDESSVNATDRIWDFFTGHTNVVDSSPEGQGAETTPIVNDPYASDYTGDVYRAVHPDQWYAPRVNRGMYAPRRADFYLP